MPLFPAHLLLIKHCPWWRCSREKQKQRKTGRREQIFLDGMGFFFFAEKESKQDSWTLTSCDFCSQYRASLASSENVWGDCAVHVKLLIVWRSSLCDSFSFSCNMKFHKNTKSAPFSLWGEQLSRLSGCSLRHPPHPPFPNSPNKTESITDSRVKQVQSNKPAPLAGFWNAVGVWDPSCATSDGP